MNSPKRIKNFVMGVVSADRMKSKKEYVVEDALPPWNEASRDLFLSMINHLDKVVAENGGQGIYHQQGKSFEQKQLSMDFLKGNLGDLNQLNPHSVASVVKRILREVHEPIMTYKSFAALRRVREDEDKLMDTIKTTVDSLPVINRTILEKILAHLHRILKTESTGATLDALSGTFGVNLIRQSESTDDRDFKSLGHRKMIAAAIIKGYPKLFVNTEESEPKRMNKARMARMSIQRLATSVKSMGIKSPKMISSFNSSRNLSKLKFNTMSSLDEDESESEIRSPPLDEKAFLSIKAIIAHINKTALQEKELYQQVGSVAEQRELNALIADQRIPDLKKYSPHSITSILKQILREKYEPVMTFRAYGVLESASCQEEDEFKSSVGKIITGLPFVNRQILQELLNHFTLVLECNCEMKLESLCSSIGIYLMRNTEHSQDEDEKSVPIQMKVASLLIVNAKTWEYNLTKTTRPMSSFDLVMVNKRASILQRALIIQPLIDEEKETQMNRFPSLTSLVARQLIQLIDFLDANALATPGLYRKQGKVFEQKQITQQMTNNNELPDLVLYSPLSIAAVIKNLLRDKYAPVLSYDAFDTISAAEDDDDLLIQTISSCMAALTEDCRRLLQVLLQHLYKLSTLPESEMNIEALASSVGIFFLRRSESVGDQTFQLVATRKKVATIMITNAFHWSYGNLNSMKSAPKDVYESMMAPPSKEKDMSEKESTRGSILQAQILKQFEKIKPSISKQTLDSLDVQASDDGMETKQSKQWMTLQGDLALFSSTGQGGDVLPSVLENLPLQQQELDAAKQDPNSAIQSTHASSSSSSNDALPLPLSVLIEESSRPSIRRVVKRRDALTGPEAERLSEKTKLAFVKLTEDVLDDSVHLSTQVNTEINSCDYRKPSWAVALKVMGFLILLKKKAKEKRGMKPIDPASNTLAQSTHVSEEAPWMAMSHGLETWEGMDTQLVPKVGKELGEFPSSGTTEVTSKNLASWYNKPKDNKPQDNIPKDNISKDNIPKDNIPKDDHTQQLSKDSMKYSVGPLLSKMKRCSTNIDLCSESDDRMETAPNFRTLLDDILVLDEEEEPDMLAVRRGPMELNLIESPMSRLEEDSPAEDSSTASTFTSSQGLFSSVQGPRPSTTKTPPIAPCSSMDSSILNASMQQTSRNDVGAPLENETAFPLPKDVSWNNVSLRHEEEPECKVALKEDETVLPVCSTTQQSKASTSEQDNWKDSNQDVLPSTLACKPAPSSKCSINAPWAFRPTSLTEVLILQHLARETIPILPRTKKELLPLLDLSSLESAYGLDCIQSIEALLERSSQLPLVGNTTGWQTLWIVFRSYASMTSSTLSSEDFILMNVNMLRKLCMDCYLIRNPSSRIAPAFDACLNNEILENILRDRMAGKRSFNFVEFYEFLVILSGTCFPFETDEVMAFQRLLFQYIIPYASKRFVQKEPERRKNECMSTFERDLLHPQVAIMMLKHLSTLTKYFGLYSSLPLDPIDDSQPRFKTVFQFLSPTHTISIEETKDLLVELNIIPNLLLQPSQIKEFAEHTFQKRHESQLKHFYSNLDLDFDSSKVDLLSLDASQLILPEFIECILQLGNSVMFNSSLSEFYESTAEKLDAILDIWGFGNEVAFQELQAKRERLLHVDKTL